MALNIPIISVSGILEDVCKRTHENRGNTEEPRVDLTIQDTYVGHKQHKVVSKSSISSRLTDLKAVEARINLYRV